MTIKETIIAKKYNVDKPMKTIELNVNEFEGISGNEVAMIINYMEDDGFIVIKSGRNKDGFRSFQPTQRGAEHFNNLIKNIILYGLK